MNTWSVREGKSEYGKQLGLMHNAQVIHGDDGDFFVVPQASTRLSRHQLEDIVSMLKTLESTNVVY